MEPEEDGGPSIGSLAERLARLAAKRRRPLRSDSSEAEAAANPAPQSGALQALRQLLDARQPVLNGLALDDAAPSCCSVPSSPPPPCAAAAADTSFEPAGGSPCCNAPGTAGSELTALEGGTIIAAMGEAESSHAELAALLARQEAAAAERACQRLEREAVLRRMQQQLAVQHMAAWHIARAWRRFLRSPARLRVVAAAVCIQAAWRGWASRQRSAALRQVRRHQQALLGDLHAAVAAGELERAQQAATQLDALGCSTPALSQLMSALERGAEDAADALHAAAASGTAEQYQAAAAAAGQYRHLLPAVQAAAAQWAARVAAAEQAVERTVQGGTLSQLAEAAAAAAALGVAPNWLQAAEQRAAARNQEAAAALRAALEALPFSAEAFTACLEQARRYGLHADAARAQQGLQQRRQRCAASLQQLAASGGTTEVCAACNEARQLALLAEADAAEARLEQRQAAAAEELRQAAHCGSLQQYEAALAQAAALHVSGSVRQTCRAQLQQRRWAAEEQLRQAAAHADLAVVRRHLQAAQLLGLDAAVAAAEQAVQARQMDVAEQLEAGTQAACAFTDQQAAAAPGPHGSVLEQQQLGLWLSSMQQLAGCIAERGAEAALAHPPAACGAWPPELRGWLVDAHRAASLELDGAVAEAAGTLLAQLQGLLAAAVQVQAVAVQPAGQPHGEGSGHPVPLDVHNPLLPSTQACLDSLPRLHQAATRIQAAWRCHRACLLSRRLAAERQASREAAAAVRIQATWRGWLCRARLAAWRLEQQKRQEQALLLERERSYAAVRIQAAWRGWRVRRLLAAARLSLQQQLAEVGSSLDLELSCGSLDGLLGGGGFTGLATFDAPEALRPELAAAAGGLPCSSAAVAPAPPSRWADSGRGTPAAPPDSRQQQEQQLPPAPAAPSAAAPAARPPAAGEAGWEFEVPATAAAFQQMRQRQLAVARRRQLEQQRRDPVARLQEFQCRTGLGRSGSSRGSAASSSNGSSSASACGLAAPRSPRAAGARASPPQQAGSPKGDRRSGSGRAPVRVRVLQLDG